ncbi:MAG: class I SAM-dependent methyltransferase [Phenylobacterium sp.]|uniref:class I SAM-dependent methyltransferase n=1 Tax=Phenylobacterium sp. TaxID=1871053 RepID=UPI002725111A|nr:class I SAM-dependent methyltransferase [Phenylobacterium sp.]MDO8902905.1 class I SAM-dependent methyltransferase [Phenylobacterium sp.]
MRRLTALVLISVMAAAGPALAQHGHGATERSAAMNRTWSEEVASVAETAARFESPEREVIALRPAIVASLDLRPGMVVADVGAGTGAYLKPLAEAVGADGHVYAVDISAPFAAYMRDRVEREGLGNVSVVLSRVDSPTLPPNAVDAILVVNTFHHFEAPEAMLAHFKAALKPGGQLAIVDFDLAHGHAGHQEVVALDRAGHVGLIQAHGFDLVEDVRIDGMRENFVLRFVRR